jgi:phosphonate transport system substrate-binding protein
MTAPHFARLAQQETGYVPLVRANRDLTWARFIVTRRAGGPRDLTALRGASVASPGALAIVSMLGVQLIIDEGLIPPKDLIIVPYPSHSSSVLAVTTGEVDAAFTAVTALNQMLATARDAVRTIATSPDVLAVMLIAREDVPPQEREKVRSLMLRFDQTDEGRAFMVRTKLQGYREVTASELALLDPDVEALKVELSRR